MHVTLRPRFEAMVQEWVRHGDFSDAADVVEEALRRMEEQDRLQLEHLRAELQVGLDQVERGEVREFTPEVQAEIWENGLKRFRAGRRPNPDVLP